MMACEPATMNDHDLLMRIDEKVVALHTRMDDFVTKKEFDPVKAIAYGLAGLVCAAAVYAILDKILI